MSEVLFRPSAPRGRGSSRGGRGGYNSRGGRASNRFSPRVDTSENTPPMSYEDEGEIGQLKKKYSASLPPLKELFPDWTDEDLVFALEDANGDLESAIEHITEGNVSQWGEVKKKNTDRSRSKVKEAQKGQGGATDSAPPSTRGGRERGGFDGRGRARGDRRGGRGGRAGAHINGSRIEKLTDMNTDVREASSWLGSESWTGDWAGEPTVPKKITGSDSSALGSLDPDDGLKDISNISKDASTANAGPEPKKGWASLFAKPSPSPTQRKGPSPVVPVVEKPLEPIGEQKIVQPALVEPLPDTAAEEEEVAPPGEAPIESTPDQHLEAPKDDLTKTNLEQLPDVSIPPATATAASTTASTQDPNILPPVTPQPRQAPSGYAASAFKATTGSVRVPSFQRRVMEQQEAVVMPANHAVDRATVQFGSMGLNGNPEDVDIDEDREEAETRAQPPQHSPVAPRASLPPSTQTQPSSDTPAVARSAPGLPPAPQTSSTDSSFNEFNRYSDTQKPYDPFSQQAVETQPQIQEAFSNQAPVQPTATTGSEYSPFYTGDQQRLPYNYYATYGQSQDTTAAPRAATGFGASGAEAQPHIPSTQPPTRYGHIEASNSGHNTPNPTVPAATQTQPSAQHIPGGQGAHGGYSYGYPYYSNPHYAASYMNQMSQHQYGRNRPMYDDARRYDDHYMPHSSQYGYGNQYGPYGKGGMYGQPQHAFSYEHSSSPANAGGGFNQGFPSRDSVYGRTGSAQPEGQPASNNTFGSGMPDVFGRSQSGYGPNQSIPQQQPASSEEGSKGFEASKAAGPSPSLAQANRPASATNNVAGQPQAQTSLPPLQGQQGQQQQGFGGYPHLNPQYGGGLGSLGHQAAATQSHHQGSGYGNYAGAGFGNNYYGNTGRGGWGGNYH